MFFPPFLVLKMEAGFPFETSLMNEQTTCCYGHEVLNSSLVSQNVEIALVVFNKRIISD